MPGAPDPLLGSDLANWVGAVLLASLLVVGPLRFRERASPRRLAAASGIVAAAVGIGLWAIPRLATAAFQQFSWSDPASALALYALGTAALALQAAGPIYAYLARDLLAPLAVGVAGTTLALYLLFQLGGETESFALFALLSPFVLGGILAVAILETGLRQLVGAWAQAT